VRTSSVGRASVSVAWITDEVSTKVVRPYHGLRDEALLCQPRHPAAYHPEQTLPSTRYHRRVESKDEAGNLVACADLAFTTVR
jgi:hypothetical protein